MVSEREQIEQAIASVESQRSVLGSAATDAALTGLRQKLTALEPQPSSEQRKIVTILFGDVSGFTKMADAMDAEDVIEAMNAVWAKLDAIIRDHGGAIDKHIGDAVMAIWGSAEAQEDDPERAIHAALAMQTALNDPAGIKVKGKRGALATAVNLSMRIGINTGLVMLGEIGSLHEFTAMGDTVNVASRLEHASPIGGVLISHDTYRHVRGVFDVLEQSPLELKGKSEPIQSYLVTAAKPRAFRMPSRGVEGIETRMVGRDAELRLLQETYMRAYQDSEMHAVTVVSEAGVGKSRLLAEFSQWIDLRPEQIWFFQGRATTQSSSLPYSLIRDMFASRFQIQESDSLARAREKIEAGVAEFTGDDSQEKAHFIGHLIGIDFSDSPHISGIASDGGQIRSRAYAHMAQFFQAVNATDGNPMVVFLEDIHWSDNESLQLVEHIAKESKRLPLMVLALSRPSIDQTHPAWGVGLSPHKRMDLQPLSRPESRTLVDEILKKIPTIPEALRELVIGGSDGNPFYMEEMVKMFLDDGVIVKSTDAWRVETEKLVTAKVPATLTGVLQARLDGLPAAEKSILQRASVVGRIFWDGTVAYLASEQTEAIGMSLLALAQREFIYKQDVSSFSGTDEYIFKHSILREVTLESVLRKTRRIYHKQIAEWLVERSGERIREATGLIADHYEQAGEMDLAVNYLEQAGRNAVSVSAHREAIGFFERALLLVDSRSPLRPPLLAELSECMWQISAYSEARERLEEALTLAHDLGDKTSESFAMYVLGELEYDQGNGDASIALNERALALARETGDQKLTARIVYILGFVSAQLGMFEQGQTYLEEAMNLAKEVGDERTIAASYSGLGALKMNQYLHDEADWLFRKGREIAKRIGDRQRLSRTTSNLGWNLVMMGRPSEAIPVFQDALEMAEELSDPLRITLVTINLGHAHAALGELDEARAALHYSLYLARRIGAQGLMLEIIVGMAGLLENHGDYEKATQWLAFALNHSGANEDTRQVAKPIIERLDAKFDGPKRKSAEAIGMKLELDAVVEKILEDD